MGSPPTHACRDLGGRKEAAGSFLGGEAPGEGPEDLSQHGSHQIVSSRRQGAQKSAVLLDRQGLRAPRPPARHRQRRRPSVMGEGAGDAGGERRRIPLRSEANQRWLQPGRFKSLSTKTAPPSAGNKWQESCLDPSLGRNTVSSREESLGASESQPVGWAEVVSQLPLGDLGTPEHLWEPVLGSSHPSAGRDLGDIPRALPFHFTDAGTETHEGKDLPEVTWL